MAIEGRSEGFVEGQLKERSSVILLQVCGALISVGLMIMLANAARLTFLDPEETDRDIDAPVG